MTNVEIRSIAQLMKKFLKSKVHLKKSELKKLVRDARFVEALTESNRRVSYDMKKKVLKQEGGIFPLIPMAARLLAPAILPTLGGLSNKAIRMSYQESILIPVSEFNKLKKGLVKKKNERKKIKTLDVPSRKKKVSAENFSSVQRKRICIKSPVLHDRKHSKEDRYSMEQLAKEGTVKSTPA